MNEWPIELFNLFEFFFFVPLATYHLLNLCRTATEKHRGNHVKVKNVTFLCLDRFHDMQKRHNAMTVEIIDLTHV